MSPWAVNISKDGDSTTSPSGPLVVPWLSWLLFWFPAGTSQRGNSAVLSSSRADRTSEMGKPFLFLLPVLRRIWL